MQHVEVTRVIPAPVEEVWRRYTDHVSWTDWAKMGRVRLDRPGEPAPNGVGSVRRISSGGISVYEEVITFEPLQRQQYRLIKGGPGLKDHLGEVTFAPHANGTLITWRCQFNTTVAGTGGLLRWFIARLFRTALAGLERTFQRGAAR